MNHHTTNMAFYGARYSTLELPKKTTTAGLI
jgi:hypothetical protein